MNNKGKEALEDKFVGNYSLFDILGYYVVYSYANLYLLTDFHENVHQRTQYKIS